MARCMAPRGERGTAVSILTRVTEQDSYAGLEFEDPQHTPFVTEVVYGVLRRRALLDWIIEHIAARPLSKITTPGICENLQVALYQMLFMDSVPLYAIVNEAVTIARSLGHAGLASFTNGVLRKTANLLDLKTTSVSMRSMSLLKTLGFDTQYPLDNGLPSPERLAVLESHPLWLINELLEKWTIDDVISLCVANNCRAPVTLRTNELRSNVQELIDGLASEGVTAKPGHLAPEAVMCATFPGIASSQLYKRGHFQVQDEGSMLITHLLDPKPGERVLDACSAPGGKATHCAELMQNEGQVVAIDMHEHRLHLVRENVSRLGLHCVKPILADARALDAGIFGSFDRILVDAPCTGTGVLRRKPDIRWRRSPADVEPLVESQKAILSSVLRLLKPGGSLVYSTCSLLSSENEKNVEWVLSSFADLGVVAVTEPVYLLPHIHGTDGFFMARFTIASR